MVPEHLKQIPIVAELESALPGALLTGKLDRGELSLEFPPENLVAACRWLKDAGGFVRLADLTAVDWHPREPRFEVVYHLHSFARNARLRLKCRVAGRAPELDSVTCVWRSANWHEREVFDLFGITFRNHPNPRRIMMPEDWEGHPLRKDYPVYGNKYGYKDE
jgi:NADH-quinone oxidoreductase subunit C